MVLHDLVIGYEGEGYHHLGSMGSGGSHRGSNTGSNKGSEGRSLIDSMNPSVGSSLTSLLDPLDSDDPSVGGFPMALDGSPNSAAAAAAAAAALARMMSVPSVAMKPEEALRVFADRLTEAERMEVCACVLVSMCTCVNVSVRECVRV